VAPPPGAAGFGVSDAWAVGPDEIIFIGTIAAPSPYTPRAYRYANGVWSVELELPASDDWSRPSISGTAPDDIWAVGGDQIHHRDASGWSRVADDGWQASVPRPSYGPNAALGMTRVRAAGRDDVWVVGVRDAEFTGGTGFILHRVNGVASLFVLDDPKSAPRIHYDYDDIYIAGANDVWLSGGSDAEGSTMDPSFLYHWDGAAWTIFGHGRFGLVGLWPTGDGGLWLLDPGDWDINGVISMARFAGDQFSAVPVEGLPRATALYSIWGSAPDDVWAAGETVARWDGRSWRVVGELPEAARSGTFVTGDPTATWLVTSGPRFFRKPRTP
jgi:hypothetical protein